MYISRSCRALLAERNPTLFNQVAKWISEWVEKIKAAFQGVNARHEEARMLLDSAQELQKLWDSAITAAVENSEEQKTAEAEGSKKTAEAGGEVQYSIARTSKMTLKEQQKEFFDGKMPSGDAFFFGETPSILKKSGIASLPLVMGQNNYKKSRKQKHGVPRRVINKLQDSLSVPLFSFDKNGEVEVVIDDYDASGKRIVVAIHKDQEMDRKPVKVIKSIYGLDAPEQWIANQISKGKTFTVYDAEKTNDFLQTYGYLASMGENNRLSLKKYHNQRQMSTPNIPRARGALCRLYNDV